MKVLDRIAEELPGRVWIVQAGGVVNAFGTGVVLGPAIGGRAAREPVAAAA